MTLIGKTAIITGFTSGIGLGIARGLAESRANVILNSFSDTAEDHALAESLTHKHGIKARYICADMRVGAACRQLIAEAGRCDILVTMPVFSMSPRLTNFRPKNGTKFWRLT